MNRITLTSLALLGFLGTAGAAHAGPFGLEFGMPFSEFKGLVKNQAGLTDKPMSVLINPPAPHELFITYMATYAPKVGLCAVIAYVDAEDLSDAIGKVDAYYEVFKEAYPDMTEPRPYYPGPIAWDLSAAQARGDFDYASLTFTSDYDLVLSYSGSKDGDHGVRATYLHGPATDCDDLVSWETPARSEGL